MPAAEQRMDLYRRIAALRTASDRDELTDELLDRYGDVPPPVEALLDGLSLHDFAGNLVRDFCARRGLSPEETAADEAALARMLRRALFG